MLKIIIAMLKIIVPAGIFAYLLWQVDPEEYRVFWYQPKRWGLLVTAQLMALAAILVSIFRWYTLVVAFEIPFTYREALRLGFLGYLLNFVSFGSVGGDLFKAILVARNKPEKRPEAVASVLLDRAMGLLGLVGLACICLFVIPQVPLSPLMIGIRNGAAIVALIAVLGLATAVFAGHWFDRLIDWMDDWPLVGNTIARMACAVRLLRKQPGTLVLLSVYALCVHSMLAMAVFLISKGTYAQHPTLAEHMMVVPPAMAAGTLPLAPGGVGYQEGALAGLFHQLPDLPEHFSGILVATIYRLVTLAIAGIGLAYYLSSQGRALQIVAAQQTAAGSRASVSGRGDH